MKKTIFTSIVIASIIGTAFITDNNKSEKYILSTETSSVEWIGKKVTGQHNGNITISDGELIVENGVLKGGKVIIDMNSITCTDLEGEWRDKLVGHLKAEDFFDSKNHATSTFVISSINPITESKGEGEPNYTLRGKLTIKGITNDVSFKSYILFKNNSMAAIGEVVVDRTKYDIKYGSSNFFEDLGNKAIDNEFIIKFKLAAKKG